MLMLPTVSALTLYSLPGLAKGPGWALLLTILSGLTLFAAQATFTLTSTTEKTLRAQGVQTQPVTRDFEEQLELHGSSIIHVFIESMPATLALEGVDSDKFQSRIRESLGGDALLSAVEAPSSATTLEGLASSMCGTQPVGFEETGGSDGPKFKDDFECISSISSAAGYENLFLQAASGEFQSKREFLEDRHFLVLDRSTWLGIGSSAPGSWGGQFMMTDC